MDDQIFSITEAKKHFSRLIARVERGERIVIARNNRPVAILSAAKRSREEVLAEIDAVRERIRSKRKGRNVLKRGETWRDLIDEGRRI